MFNGNNETGSVLFMSSEPLLDKISSKSLIELFVVPFVSSQRFGCGALALTLGADRQGGTIYQGPRDQISLSAS
jgi:hypothetical protein